MKLFLIGQIANLPLRFQTYQKRNSLPNIPYLTVYFFIFHSLKRKYSLPIGKSKDFQKVYVRGKCVSFSPNVINKFLGRTAEAQPELEVTDNEVCQVITAKQVKTVTTQEMILTEESCWCFVFGAGCWLLLGVCSLLMFFLWF